MPKHTGVIPYAGANPLQKVCPKGQTIIHEINQKLENTSCNLGVVAARLEKELPISPAQREKMVKVLDYLLKVEVVTVFLRFLTLVKVQQLLIQMH